MISQEQISIYNTSSGNIISALWNMKNIHPITTLSFPPTSPTLLDSRKTSNKYLTAQQCVIYLLDNKYYRVISTTITGQIITMTLDEYILESDITFITNVAKWLGIKNLNYSNHRNNSFKLNKDTTDFCTLLWLSSNNTLISAGNWLNDVNYSFLGTQHDSPPYIDLNISENILLGLMYPKYFGDIHRPYLWLAFLTGVLILKSSNVDDVKYITNNLESEISTLQVVRFNRLFYHNLRIKESVNSPYEELALRLDSHNINNKFNRNVLSYNHKNFNNIISEFGLKPPGDKSSHEEYMRASIPYIKNIFDENKTDIYMINKWESNVNSLRIIDYYRLGHDILSYYTDKSLLKTVPHIKYGTRYELATYIIQSLTK